MRQDKEAPQQMSSVLTTEEESITQIILTTNPHFLILASYWQMNLCVCVRVRVHVCVCLAKSDSKCFL